MPGGREERHSFLKMAELPVIIRFMKYFMMKYVTVIEGDELTHI